MKKNNKSFLAIALSSVLTLSMLTACGGGGGNSSSGANGGGDSSSSAYQLKGNETVLKVGVFNGGLGHAWAKTLESEFEEKFANYSFEEGKMGVDVQINPQKDQFKVTTINSKLTSNDGAEDIYYTCYDFYRDSDFAGLLMNMKDLVQENAYTDDGEFADGHWDSTAGKWVYDNATKSMEDKMTTFHQNSFYTQGIDETTSGYYALPYETSITGLIYDHDLFVEKGWLDYDTPDGLPGTMEEFWDLIDKILGAQMIAYISGPSNYWEGFDNAFIAQYEGLDKAKLDYTYDGEYTFEASQAAKIKANYADVETLEGVTVNQDGSYTVQITPKNAWMLAYTKGKELHTQFMRDITDIVNTPFIFDSNMHLTSYNFEKIQEVYIKSVNKENGQKQIAMLMEGEWWENEANRNGYFNTTGGYGFRDFRFMPIPRIEGQKTSGRSLGTSTAGTNLIVNAKTKQKELCRLWLQYTHSEHALEVFTLANGCVRDAFDYDLNDTQLAQLTPFGQNVYNLKKNETDDVTIYAPADYNECHNFYLTRKMGGFGHILGSTLKGAYPEQGTTWGVMYGRAGDVDDNYLTFAEFYEGIGTKGEAGYVGGVYDYYDANTWMATYNNWKSNNS